MKQQLIHRGQLIGRSFLYVVIVYLFYQIFQSVGATKDRVWYFAITEWVILSTAPIAFQMERDIRSSQIVCFMLKPMSYLILKFCDCIGTSSVRFIILGILCIILCYLLTHSFPSTFFVWIMGLVFGFLGVLLYTMISMLIGISSFWIRDIRLLVLLNTNATFCFGGLIVPLEFYSNTFKTISFITPYPCVLWWPAKWLTGGSINLIYSFFMWGGWFLLITASLIFLYNRCLKSFVVDGG